MLTKPKQLQFEVVDVTPSIAESWLSKNDGNRKLAKAYVSRFAQDMRNGSWQVTGDAIKFDRNSRLIDGQHRLRACVQSGVSFRTMVIYGLEPELQMVIDTGKPRTGADVVSMHGLPNSSAFHATMRVILAEKVGLPPSAGGSQISVTHTDLLACMKKHPKLDLYVFRPGTFPRGVALGWVSYINYVLSTILNEQDAAQSIATVLKTGVPAYSGDPVQMVRERMLATAKTRRDHLWWSFKHAVNLHREMKPVERFRTRTVDCPLAGLDTSKL